MVNTLREVLRRKKPEPDTLGLMPSHRLLLCFLLLDDSIPSWKNLAEHIGKHRLTTRTDPFKSCETNPFTMTTAGRPL